MMDLSELSVDKLCLWSPESLKTFLSLRKKSVQGSFDDFVAREVHLSNFISLSGTRRGVAHS